MRCFNNFNFFQGVSRIAYLLDFYSAITNFSKMVRPSVRRRHLKNARAQRLWNDKDNEGQLEVSGFPILAIIVPNRLMLAEMKFSGAALAKRRLCVLKTDFDDQESLERELRFLRGIKHKHVIKTYSVIFSKFIFTQ
jgi:hypothetical protein